jgi:hypothetical protein
MFPRMGGGVAQILSEKVRKPYIGHQKEHFAKLLPVGTDMYFFKIIFKKNFYFIHMCIQCLGHFSSLAIQQKLFCPYLQFC